MKLKDEKALEWHYEGHYAQELEKLDKVRAKKSPANQEELLRRRVRDSAVERIRFNREKRLAAKTSLASNSSGGGTSQSKSTFSVSTMPKCPVCDLEIDEVDYVAHIEGCLQNYDPGNDPGNSSDEDLDVDDVDGGYETYTWAGHTRVRATSLVEGGLRGAGFMTITQGDEDTVLDIENDDDVTGRDKGSAQYTDADVIIPVSETAQEKEERENLRQVLIGEDTSLCKSSEIDDGAQNDDEDETVMKSPDLMSMSELQSAVAQLRKENGSLRQQVLCNICFDTYTKPVVSVVCWHVHCESCWLRALGTKKLCPQCKIIIQPRDLRRVFL